MGLSVSLKLILNHYQILLYKEYSALVWTANKLFEKDPDEPKDRAAPLRRANAPQKGQTDRAASEMASIAVG